VNFWPLASWLLALISGAAFGLWYSAENTGFVMRPISHFYSNGVDSTRCVEKLLLDYSFITLPFEKNIISRYDTEIPFTPGVHITGGD